VDWRKNKGQIGEVRRRLLIEDSSQQEAHLF
jgi:hypothetical protein